MCCVWQVPIEELENLTLEELDDLTRQVPAAYSTPPVLPTHHTLYFFLCVCLPLDVQEAAYYQRLESIRIRKASQEGRTVVSPKTSLAQSPIDTLPVPLGHGRDGSGAENQYQQQQQQPHQQPHQQQQQHKSCYPPPLPRGPTPSASTGLLQPSHNYNTAAVARNSPLVTDQGTHTAGWYHMNVSASLLPAADAGSIESRAAQPVRRPSSHPPHRGRAADARACIAPCSRGGRRDAHHRRRGQYVVQADGRLCTPSSFVCCFCVCAGGRGGRGGGGASWDGPAERDVDKYDMNTDRRDGSERVGTGTVIDLWSHGRIHECMCGR